MGIFTDNVMSFYSNGLVCIPVGDNKAPILGLGWQKYCDDMPSLEDISRWAKDFNHAERLGLCCGKASGVVAFDFDYAYDERKVKVPRAEFELDLMRVEAAILDRLPYTPSIKIGKKGWTRFYRWSEELDANSNVQVDRNGVRLFDFLSWHKQTVVPPSLHSNDLYYRWAGQPLQECMDAVPEIRLSHIQALKATFGSSHGYDDSSRHGKLFLWLMRELKTERDPAGLINALIEQDRLLNGSDKKGLYLIDKNHFNSRDAFTNAERWVRRVLRWKSEKQVDYPSKANGFFNKIPKLTAKGEPVLDKAGLQVYKDEPNYNELCAYLGEEEGLATAQSFSFKYNKDSYRRIESLELKNLIDHLTLKKAKPYIAEDFKRAAEYKNFKPKEFFEHPDGLINLKNGVLDVKTRELKPHSKATFFRYVLPHAYNPNATCSRWLESLDYAFEGNKDLISISAEIFGYVLLGGDPWLHKAFVLSGTGRNGKSNWLNALKCLIGKENFSSIPMSNLDKPFSVVMADGKLANIVGELEGKALNSEIFKIAVSGEELTAAQKGKDEYQMRFLARLVFAANNLPGFKDTSVGNYEKLCIIPFNRYINPKDRDPNIFAKIRPEMSGILNWALDGLDRLIERGMLPELDILNEKIDEYRAANDSTYQWTQEFVHASVDTIGRSYLLGAYYAHYTVWCDAEGRFPVAKNHFSRGLATELRRVDPTCLPSKKDNKLSLTGRFNITASTGNYEQNPK